MTFSSIGDQSRLFLSRQSSLALRESLNRLSGELASGRKARPATESTGDTARLLGLGRSLTALAGFRDAAGEAAHVTAMAQAALGEVQETASRLGTALAASPGAATAARIAAARDGMADVVVALNGRAAGRSLFAGTASDRAPLAEADAMLTALSAAIAGETTAAGVAARLDAWFDAPGGGFETAGYRGSGGAPAFRIAEGESVAIGLNAGDATLRSVLKGLAMAALAGDPALAASPDAQAALLRSGAETLLGAEAGLIGHRAALGATEAAIEDRATRNAAETTALEQARSAITDADPYRTASALQEVSTRLETIYTVTARLSRLNLAEYLR